jgi:hypothetical protein
MKKQKETEKQKERRLRMSDKILSAFAILAAGFISLATTVQADEVKITSVQVSEQIYTLKGKGGKTVQEAVAATPLADLEESWGNGLFKSDLWIELIYSGVY